MLKGKTILLGVAAYKIAHLASALVKSGAKVHVLMTKTPPILSILLLLRH